MTTYNDHIRRVHEVRQMRTSHPAPPTVHPDAVGRLGAPGAAATPALSLPSFPRRPRSELMCAQPQVGPKRRVSVPRIVAHCGWSGVSELWAAVHSGRVVLHRDLVGGGVPVRLDTQGRLSLTASMCLHLGVDVGDQVQVIGNAKLKTATLLSLTRALELILEDS
ncbi:hypothetical protein [Nocardioides zeicaulis]|uniref:HPr domain-containing protein n=1 Tax=Nocardioides zeicaulis TaxID=1776857 RepID=A0ABV6E1I2_9ACTN